MRAGMPLLCKYTLGIMQSLQLATRCWRWSFVKLRKFRCAKVKKQNFRAHGISEESNRFKPCVRKTNDGTRAKDTFLFVRCTARFASSLRFLRSETTRRQQGKHFESDLRLLYSRPALRVCKLARQIAFAFNRSRSISRDG